MVELLVIADDFTGALDTGVQFAEAGAATEVIVNDVIVPSDLSKQVETLVIDTESRHLCAENAYQIVYQIVSLSKRYGVPYIYKKTDSGLRGNIGAELTATLNASQKMFLPFVPAYPQINRTTYQGVQYIGGIPVAESVFGQDPFNPVRYSLVSDIIHQQSDINTCIIARGQKAPSVAKATIGVYDAVTEADERAIGATLLRDGNMNVTAGCAGFAAVIPDAIGIKRRAVRDTAKAERVLVINGSLNPITKRQIAYALGRGIHRICITDEERLCGNFSEARLGQIAEECRHYAGMLIDGSCCSTTGRAEMTSCLHDSEHSTIQRQIPVSLGKIARKILESMDVMLVVFGGDTLLGVLDQLRVKEITPLTELEPGVVLSTFDWCGKKHSLVSKSGGMGKESAIMDILEKVMHGEENDYAETI